jgi:hypothetical protein
VAVEVQERASCFFGSVNPIVRLIPVCPFPDGPGDRKRKETRANERARYDGEKLSTREWITSLSHARARQTHVTGTQNC